MKRFLSLLIAVVCVMRAASQMPALPAQAITLPPIFNVNSTVDVPADPGDTNYSVCRTAANNSICTLRAAIDKANHFAGGGITIRLPAVDSPGKYALSEGTLMISNTMDIQGAGARGVVIDASANGISTTHGVIMVLSGTVSMSGLTIQGGHTTSNGGGIFLSPFLTMTLDSMLIQNNHTSYSGGGIEDLGALIIRNSAIVSNSADLYGGGIGSAGFSMLLLQNSTVSNNTAVVDSGAIVAAASTVLFNDTIAYNVAGTHLDQSNAVGGISNGLTPIDIRNTILAPNYGTFKPASTIVVGERDCSGVLHSGSTSIIGPAIISCAYTGDWIYNGITRLDRLQYNGGQTPTHALLPDSPALDAGEFPNCTELFGSPILRDQRGMKRNADGGSGNGSRCDIGAVEMQRLLFLPMLAR